MKIVLFFVLILSVCSLKETKLGSIHFINTGCSDSMLIESNGKYGLIDTADPYLYSEHEVEKVVIDPSKGEKDQGKENPKRSVQRVIDYLNVKNVKHLEFILATHSHSDHLGGIPAVAYYFVDNNTYFYYRNYSGTIEDKTQSYANSAYFRAAYDSMKIKGAKLIEVTGLDTEFNLGEINIKLLTTDYKERCYGWGENCNSITELVTVGNNRIFLEADLEYIIDKDISGQVGIVDLLKVGHHGLGDSASYELISKIRPKQAIITNDFIGAGSKATIAYMENELKTKVYITGGAGDIIENAAIRLDLFEEGYTLENTGNVIDISEFNGWTNWNDHKTYLVNGNLLKGWNTLEWGEDKKEDKFYFNNDGIMLTGWQELEWEKGKNKFYFDPENGYMLRNCCRVIDGVEYCFDENGVLIE